MSPSKFRARAFLHATYVNPGVLMNIRVPWCATFSNILFRISYSHIRVIMTLSCQIAKILVQPK